MNCPECAAPLAWQARFTELIVCDSCHTASRLNHGAVQALGKMAQLAHTPGPLYLGATGRLGRKTFTVLGRVRYQYAQGFWDEWLLSMSDGSQRWVAEDEAEHTVMRLVKRGDAVSLMRRAKPGGRLSLGERSFHVDEKSRAHCAGGEGQLPFVVRQGEEIGYADLSGGKDSVATIEIDSDGAGRVYVGKKVSAAVFKMDAPMAGSDLDDFRAGVASPEGIKVATGADAKQLACINCGAPVGVKAGELEASCAYCSTINPTNQPVTECPACDKQVVLTGGSLTLFSTCPSCKTFLIIGNGRVWDKEEKNNRVDRHRIYFKLGQRFRFDDVEYVLTGEVCTKEVDDGVYYCREYYLYNPRNGYRILEEENGHFCFSERVSIDSEFYEVQKTKVYHDKKKFKVFELGSCHVEFVRGQLPYVPELGAESQYADAICPPYVLSKSTSESEVEYYYGRYVSQDELLAATGLRLEDLPQQYGVAAAQPYVRGPVRRVAAVASWIFFVLNVALWLSSPIDGNLVAALQDPAPRSGNLVEALSEPFEIRGKKGKLMLFDVTAPVDNDWVYVDGALVNTKDEVVLEFGTEISYYHGVSGGESWSEGSRSNRIWFLAPEPGSYQLLLRRESAWNKGASYNRKDNPLSAVRANAVRVFVRSDVVDSFWSALVAVLCLIYAALEAWLKSMFNQQRWSSVLEDD